MKNQNNSNEIEIISQNVPNNALYQSEEECKDQESIQSSTTPEPSLIHNQTENRYIHVSCKTDMMVYCMLIKGK